MERSNGNYKKGDGSSRIGLLDLVFSWSMRDVLNRDLYKYKVKRISGTFSSTTDFFSAFKHALIEETRANLHAGVDAVGQSPACEVTAISISKHHNPPKELYYDIRTKKITQIPNPGPRYEPEPGDLIVLTSTRPRRPEDLARPGFIFRVGLVATPEGAVLDQGRILVGKELGSDMWPRKHVRVYATYLINMITNIRIWKALHPDPKGANLRIIQSVLNSSSCVGNDCTLCISGAAFADEDSNLASILSSFKLDESQKSAIISSITMRKCTHQEHNTVKLIWGPPGTGKTKTIACLLLVLLKMKCRTLACAPTNMAILQLAKRLLGIVIGSLKNDTYGLGDIVLFGNGERMKVDDHDELVDVFLDYRAEILLRCLSTHSGWTSTLRSMISLLENPEKEYSLYLRNRKDLEEEERDSEVESNDQSEDSEEEENGDEENAGEKQKGVKSKNRSKYWKGVIDQSLKKNNANNSKEEPNKLSCKGEEERKDGDKILTYEELVRKRFDLIGTRLAFCMKNLYTHLPTAFITLDVVKKMIVLLDVLKVLEEKKDDADRTYKLEMNRSGFLEILKSLPERFPVPDVINLTSIKTFCLANASLVFCTASSSAKLDTDEMKPVEMVVIDEAAQLKECESAIPLQLPGLRHAILIGDDQQLPAMVQSQVAERADFGRSLFERLTRLGQKKHLLEVQYRMHPAISLFPNKEFYQNRIINASNVKEKCYDKHFLQGDMYKSYSFIDVARGKENFDKGHSPRNLVEAAVVDVIIAKLFKEYSATRQNISVGVISPYKGQVACIQERIGKKYEKSKMNGFCVSVRSVDGFQGGEEDVIIISTVRCNGKGSVGFLYNHQRTNVALTRARYCLWVLGSGTTLIKSSTVWTNLVIDAKDRGCFYDADAESDLERAITEALLESGESNLLFSLDSLQLDKAIWKLIFTDEFKSSFKYMKNKDTVKEVLHLLKKLAEGWRERNESESETDTIMNAMKDLSPVNELLETYKVDNGELYLVWTVDIRKQFSEYTQVIKIWDILHESEVLRLAKRLNMVFGTYDMDLMNSCKHKSCDGDFVVPMTWPIDLSLSPESLSSKLSATSLGGDQFGASSSSFGHPRRSYTREFLLSSSEWAVSKKLPNGFDESILSEFNEASHGIQNRQRTASGLSVPGFRYTRFGSGAVARGRSGYNPRVPYRWDSRSSERSDTNTDSGDDVSSEGA